MQQYTYMLIGMNKVKYWINFVGNAVSFLCLIMVVQWTKSVGISAFKTTVFTVYSLSVRVAPIICLLGYNFACPSTL